MQSFCCILTLSMTPCLNKSALNLDVYILKFLQLHLIKLILAFLLGYETTDQLFDLGQFRSSTFQRPFQYLLRLDQNANLSDVEPQTPEGTPQVCLQTLLRLV